MMPLTGQGLALTLSEQASATLRGAALTAMAQTRRSRDDVGRQLGVSGPRISQVLNTRAPLRLEAAITLSLSLGLDLATLAPEVRTLIR